MRLKNPAESCCQSRLCRNTRMVFMPRLSAQPSSRSIVGRSNVSACHISNSLIAVLGMKLLPTSQGCDAYHSSARCADHVLSAGESGQEKHATEMRTAINVKLVKKCLRIFARPGNSRSRETQLQLGHRSRRKSVVEHLALNLQRFALRNHDISMLECIVRVNIRTGQRRRRSRLQARATDRNFGLARLIDTRVHDGQNEILVVPRRRSSQPPE